MKRDRFREEEQLYRSYQRLKIKWDLLQPWNGQILNQVLPNQEQQTVERLELEQKIKLIQAYLDIMTQDERLFIEYRYFQEKEMEVVSSSLNWSLREIFRLRQSVLAKTRWMVSPESMNIKKA
jgi:DNA-directed RNA polymerase specialized sigma subunit